MMNRLVRLFGSLNVNTKTVNNCAEVGEAVQDILLTLFTTVYNHQDDEGRCYSDSMAELPEHDEVDGRKLVLLLS